MVVADILARYKKLGMQSVLLLTGTDEHGVKVVENNDIQLINRYKTLPRKLARIL